MRLRSNRKAVGAAYIAGNNAKRLVGEDAAVKAYQRIQAEIEEAEKSVRELQVFLIGE